MMERRRLSAKLIGPPVTLVAFLLLSCWTDPAGAAFDTRGLARIEGTSQGLRPNLSGARRHLLAASSASNCTIEFQGSPIFFSVCVQDSSGFTFRWNDQGSNVVQVSVSNLDGGWIGFGLGSKMVGSSAIIAFPATGGNSVGGIYANQYYLAGQDTGSVNPSSGSLQLDSNGIQAEYIAGVMTMLFTLTLSPSQYPQAPIIFAKGGAGNPSSGRIPEHSDYYQGTIDWASTAPGTSAGLEAGGTGTTITKAHGILQAIVWTIIFPAGILFARFFRHKDPLWWHLHRGFQGIGFIVFVIALGLGLKAQSNRSGPGGAHAAIAVVLLVAVVAQVLAAVLRPKKEARARPAWNLYHHWVGRSAVLLAIVNIYLGLYLYKAGAGTIAAYTVVWIAVLLIFIAFEIFWRVRGPWSQSYKQRSSIPTVTSMTNLRGSPTKPGTSSADLQSL